MALALRREGKESFVILERATSVGGTWRENTYPGVACDVPSHLYGFADHPNPAWSSVFAEGPEIHDYLEQVVRDAGLADRVILEAPMAGAQWNGEVWLIAAGGRLVMADNLVMACGRLTEPRAPNVPGLESFPGPLFHSARWDDSVDLRDKKVAVIGSGASAVQLAPELARLGSRVTIFQRTPAWILAKGNRAYSPAEQEGWQIDSAELEQLRDTLYWEGEERFRSRAGDELAAATARDQALAHLHAHVADPDMRRALTPQYAFGCKRVLLSDAFYPAIAAGEVSLEPSALAAVEGTTLIAASGARYSADAVVLATGFETTRQPYGLLVANETGMTLDQHWSAGMTSVGSTLVTGFPNLFVLNGPNASLGHNSAVLIMEAQAEFAARLISSERGPIRVALETEASYTQEIVERSAGTSWVAGGCRNWYVDERSARLTLLWPGTVAAFRERLAHVESDELEPAPSRDYLLVKGSQ